MGAEKIKRNSKAWYGEILPAKSLLRSHEIINYDIPNSNEINGLEHSYASRDFTANNIQRHLYKPKIITIFKNGKYHKNHYSKKDTILFQKKENKIIHDIWKQGLPRFYLKINSHCKCFLSNADITSRKIKWFQNDAIVNAFSTKENHSYPHNVFARPTWRIYRCQFNTEEESCCCSCNSDAMFEVMKSLYDCYKKKNCDNCKCILCGHLPREERRLVEQQKSVTESRKISEGKVKKKAKSKDLSAILKGKDSAEKEKVLRDMAASGAPLPKGKTKSEKELIKKIKAESPLPEKSDRTIATKRISSSKLRKAKEAGLLTPLQGKSPNEKEKILRGLAMNGIPLPKVKTTSEKKLIEKVRKDVGLPPEPITPADKKIYKQAFEAGLIIPLEGKPKAEKEKILRGLADLGVPLPQGRTPSEKSLIAKIQPERRRTSKERTLSQKFQKAKDEGLLTPLEGKTDDQKKKILKELVKNGVPLPEGKTASEKKIIKEVRDEMGLPPKPTTPVAKEKYHESIKAGLITPLEGKSPSEKEKHLKGLANLGAPMPTGRTDSEKALIEKVKGEGPIPESGLQGKTRKEEEKILKNLAMNNKPLPEGKTPSEKSLIKKVRAELGLPPTPKSKSEKEKYKQAEAAGLIVPLEGKTKSEIEKILKGQADMDIELPEGRTASEKSIINKIRESKKKRTGEKGIGPPALPLEKRKKLDAKTQKVMKEGKGPSNECICGLLTPESERIYEEPKISRQLKSPSEKLKAVKKGGLLTPLEGKTAAQKEQILKDLAKNGVPLPLPKTPSEKKIIQKVQNDLGLPPVPTTPSMKGIYDKAQAAGTITPLEGKTPSQKEKILTKQAEMGLTLPVGRTPSEKALIDKIRATIKPKEKGRITPETSEKIRKAKAAGLLTPLDGKTPSQKADIVRQHLAAGIPLPEPKSASDKKIMQDVIGKSSKILQGKTPAEKEKILKNIAKQGLPLPEPRTTSEKAIVDKVRAELTPSIKLKQAKAAGLITPLGGKPPAEKERILKGLAKAGIPLPEAASPSEKKIIEKVRHDLGLPPEPTTSSVKEKIKKAHAAGIITPLEGKTTAQKGKVLRKMHEAGIPLPIGRTSSEKSLIKKIKAKDKGEVASEKLKEATMKGLLTPLEGKSAAQKEKILRGKNELGLPLPEGRIPSEKEMIAGIKATAPKPLEKGKAASFTALEGKSPEQKEKILKEKVLQGIPLPEPKTALEKKIINKVRADVGLPPEPKNSSEKLRHQKALAAGLMTPLQGKSKPQKEKILQGQAELGLPLPEGRTTSEKAMIQKIKQGTQPKSKIKVRQPEKLPENIAKLDKKTAKIMKEGKGPSDECICGLLTPESQKETKKSAEMLKVPSKKLRKANAAGLLTPLKGKSPAQKEKILKDLAMQSIPLPEAKTASEKKLIAKVRNELGLPPEPKTPSMKEKYDKAVVDNIIAPLEGKTNADKEKQLRKQAALGLPLPVGRTPSEKAMIARIKEEAPSEKNRKAQAVLLTPLKGKSTKEKEKILQGHVDAGIPLPKGETASEKSLIRKFSAKAESMPGKIRTKSRKVGVTKSKGGIVEEFQDVIKTTTCDRGCGCDKKKIRFKHSYVKIRVTSPDISSLCPCPEECIPGVKGGVFIDNEGIKVTVGRVTYFPTISSKKIIEDHTNIYKKYSTSVFDLKSLIHMNESKIKKRTNKQSRMATLAGWPSYSKSESYLYLYRRLLIYHSDPSSKNKFGIKNIDSCSEKSLISLKSSINSNMENCFSCNSVCCNRTDSEPSLVTIPSTITVWSYSTISTFTNSSSSIVQSCENHQFTKFSSLNNILTFRKAQSSINFSEYERSLFQASTGKKFQIYRAIYNVRNDDLSSDDHIGYIEGIDDIHSSTVIIITSSSNESSSGSYNSTIYLDLDDNHSFWKPATSDLRRFKICKRGYACGPKKPSSNISQHIGAKQNCIKGNVPDQTINNICEREMSTDTTEDRPCCCGVTATINGNMELRKQQVDMVSEFLKPMIIKDALAQGLNHKYMVNLSDSDFARPTNPTLNHFERCKPTPVRLCKVPSCSGHKSCHDNSTPDTRVYVPPNDLPTPTLNKNCDCSPAKLKKLIEENTQLLISKACGNSENKLRNIYDRKHAHLPNEITADNKLRTCTSSMSNSQSYSRSNKKNKRCPCEEHQKLTNDNERFNTTTSDMNNNCKCEDWSTSKKNKNITCECPEELEPEIDVSEFLDDRQLRKNLSDLTQATSGFKITVPRKKSESEVSFEEALKFYAEYLENDNNQDETCACKDKKKKKSQTECECTYEPDLAENTEESAPAEEPFTGIKFRIDGKGTASKGLSGILCFE